MWIWVSTILFGFRAGPRFFFGGLSEGTVSVSMQKA